MSYVNYDDPRARASQREYEAASDYADALDREIVRLRDETLALARHCDPYMPCPHLPMVRDYSVKGGTGMERRTRLLGESLAEQLDHVSRPDTDTLMGLLMLAARGDNVRHQAESILKALCDRIGEQHAEVSE